MKALVRIVIIIAVTIAITSSLLFGWGWLFLRYNAGEKFANRVAARVLPHRIELANTIVDLPSSSIRTVGLSLPYTGTLSIELAVRQGNDIGVFLITPDQIEKIKANQSFEHIQGFEAEKTKSYRRSGRVESGIYHLVLLDKTLGILSQSSSDIEVTAKLEP